MRNTAIMFAAAALLFPACSRQNPVTLKTPRIAITLASDVPATLYPGDSARVQFVLKRTGGISAAFVTVDGVRTDSVAFDAPVDSASVGVTYKAMDSYAGNTVDIAVSASGPDGAFGHYDVPVFVLATKPSITIDIPSSVPYEFKVNGEDSLRFDVSVTSATTDMKSITVCRNDVQMPQFCYDFTGDLKSQTLAFHYKPTLADVGDAVVFKFSVMDVNGNIVEALYSVSFTKEKSLQLNEFTGLCMSFQKSSAYGNFLNAETGTIYPAAGAAEHCADIDIAWFYSANASTIGVALSCPVAQNIALTYNETNVTSKLGGAASDAVINWSTRNEVNYREISITAEQFVAISDSSQVRELFSQGTQPDNDHVVFKRKAGAVTAFKIARTGKYGVIRVTQVSGPDTGLVKFDYKIQK